MKIESFIKRLNATEVGESGTNDTYIAIPREVDLSGMLVNQQAMTVYDRAGGILYTPENSNIKYVRTGQNNQERISGLGQFFRSVRAGVGDEILIEKITDGEKSRLYLDFCRRNVIVFQKNKDWAEILTPGLLEPFRVGGDYVIDVTEQSRRAPLLVRSLGRKRKKKISPADTEAYDLLIDGESILPRYGYLDYIEISSDGETHRLARMKTFVWSSLETMDGSVE